MTENNKELKVCPFCAETRINNIAATGGWLCKCNNCFARTTYFKTKEEAIEAWNTRHNEAPTGEIGGLNNPLDSFYKDSSEAISDSELEVFAMAVMEHLLDETHGKKGERALSFSRIIRRIYDGKVLLLEQTNEIEAQKVVKQEWAKMCDDYANKIDTQLQQAQKMREALEKLINHALECEKQLDEFHGLGKDSGAGCSIIILEAKQALNQEGV